MTFQTNHQSMYANNLRQNYGYPLRSPAPSSRTEDGTGLSIGDVGHVNEEGAFEVLDLPKTQPKVKIDRKNIYMPGTMAIPQDTPIFRGVKRIGLESSDCYRFIATLKEGAILILPSGAQRHEVQDQQALDDICAFAVQHARSWRNSCPSRPNTLFLITGLYNTTSWTLGAFDSCEIGHEIVVTKSKKQGDNDEAYKWAAASTVYAQTCKQKSNYENQTVFIKGFKITFRDKKTDRVEPLGDGQNTWTSRVRSSLKRLACLLRVPKKWQEFLQRSMSVERYPKLSQPPHYWDLINSYLIEKCQADVAVTHDDVWIKMLKELPDSELEEVKESYLRDYVDREYECLSNTTGAVYLHRRSEDPHTAHEESESSSATEKSESSSATENSYIVIKDIRAENVTVGLGYIPAGFFVCVDVVGGTSRRTENKPAPVHDHVIQWDNRIHLPFNPSTKVRLVICASFELSPMLGRGVPLGALEIYMSDLLSKPTLLFKSSEMKDPLSPSLPPSLPSLSLLFSAQEWQGDHWMPDHVVHEDEYSVPQAVTDATDSGQRDLHFFYRTHRKEDLESSIKHFKDALELQCPTENHAARMSNLAKAQFLSDQFFPPHQFFDSSVQLFQNALQSRVGDHLDRPMTLLSLSQALLYYGASRHDELHQRLPDLMAICPPNTHEHRGAELVQQTYDRIRLIDSNDPNEEELKTLISKLESAAQESPDDYFDKPIRFNNLGLALRRRFQLFHKPDDALDKATGWLEKAVQITPHWHPDKSRYEDDWRDALLYRFEQQHEAPITRRS